jgi:3'-5' exonuclease
MRVLKYINTEDVLAFDIETVRIAENFLDLNEGYQSAWKYKNKQDGVIPDVGELQKLWVKTASLYPEFSKVCAVSVAYISKGKMKVKGYASESEVMILKALAKDWGLFYNTNPQYRLLGHASQYFDVPFLGKRFIINRMELPILLDETDKKPWEKKNIDTNELWRSFGTGAGSSLQALCNCLDVPVSKVDLVGDQVGQAYYKGEIARIGSYCNLDAIATLNVYLRLKGEDIFQVEDVVFANDGDVLEPVPFLQTIFSTKTLTPEIKHAITSFAGDITYSELSNVRSILTAALIKDDGTLDIEHENFILEL